MLESFVVDGVIAGVGSVIVFLPQILILFLFIILMEDTGYLARAAFLVDRAMRCVGLSGQSVIPLLSSFACAVPSIMATRVIPNRRDRIATILAAPFMTCSARLPVYALLIGAFVPARSIGFFNLQGLVLFGLYVHRHRRRRRDGAAAAQLGAARREPDVHPRVAGVPRAERPHVRDEAARSRARIPRPRGHRDLRGRGRRLGADVFSALAGRSRQRAMQPRAQADGCAGRRRARGAARRDRQPGGARTISRRVGSDERGSGSSPCFAPLGWDWRVSAAVIAGFPAREVVVAVLGTIYAVGGEADEQTLAGRLTAARARPTARPVFTLPMVLGLLLFYAWCSAVRGDARRHSPRDEQLALADFRLELHDGARLRRRIADLSAG